MNLDHLDFERPIAEIQAKIDHLRFVASDDEEESENLVSEIGRLEKKRDDVIRSVFAKLSAVQIFQLSRHPQRPYTLDYIKHAFTDFTELHGDRAYADDKAIICGLGRLHRIPVAIIGHQKGRTTKEKVKRNFGMPRPEGYRKAQRIMKLAEKFSLPVITLIDTPGAYPGIGAEERGQSEAIATSLKLMVTLKTPTIATIVGEGGSGGALAIGVADKINIMQYSTYAVISPEGCASILWKSADRANEAAEAMGVTADKLFAFGLVDKIIDEPSGGAHRDHKLAAKNLAKTLVSDIKQLSAENMRELTEKRYRKYIDFGNFNSP